MLLHQTYMRRCLQLAKLAASMVAPNPMVGSVLVYDNRIIGEGYHQQYGFAHAEVNCLNSVEEKDKPLIGDSTLYVSLEPCAHYGKTPPCADLIIKHAIKKVVVACRDPFEKVAGRGIEKLRAAGIEVIVGILEEECMALNKRFFTSILNKRPYILLKWAQTQNKIIGVTGGKRLLITNDYTNRLVHKWRSREQAIMVGTTTALLDDPQLNNRLWAGKSPVRIVLDLHLRLPHSLQVFNGEQKTVVINYSRNAEKNNITFIRIEKEKALLPQIIQACLQLNIQSLLVEGGRQLIQTFIDGGLWHEARVIENTQLVVEEGVPAPVLANCFISKTEKHFDDTVTWFTPI